MKGKTVPLLATKYGVAIGCALVACIALANTSIEAQVRSYEAAELPSGRHVFVIGGSDIREWQTIRDDLAPVDIVPRGLQGATLNTWREYVDRLVLRHEPIGVVIAAGQTEFQLGTSPEDIARAQRELIAHIRDNAPHARIYAVGLRPTPVSSNAATSMQRVNQSLRSFCKNSHQCTYVDTANVFMTPRGVERRYFRNDGVGLSKSGYAALADALRAPLLETMEQIPKAPTALTVE